MEEREVESSTESTHGRRIERGTEDATYLTPAVDIYETDRAVVLLADMPGVSPENLDIDISDGVLSIAGKIVTEPEDGLELTREFRTGDYCRSFRVTSTVNQGNVTACMRDGVLRVVLPKAKKAVARRIPIVTG